MGRAKLERETEIEREREPMIEKLRKHDQRLVAVVTTAFSREGHTAHRRHMIGGKEGSERKHTYRAL